MWKAAFPTEASNEKQGLLRWDLEAEDTAEHKRAVHIARHAELAKHLVFSANIRDMEPRSFVPPCRVQALMSS